MRQYAGPHRRRPRTPGRPPAPPERTVRLRRCPAGLALVVLPTGPGGRLLSIARIPALYTDREVWDVAQAVDAAGALPEPIDDHLAFAEIVEAGIRAGVLEEEVADAGSCGCGTGSDRRTPL
jgi:hypothetical protein